MSKVVVMDHPLIRHKLTMMRMKETDHAIFRKLANELTYLVLFESTRGLRTRKIGVETPLESCTVDTLDEDIVVIPILRAGLSMLDGVLDLIPTARAGFIGMYRDHDTLEPVEYFSKVPDVNGSRVVVLDPMLATGGSASDAIKRIKTLEPKAIDFVCLIAAPEGVRKLRTDHPDVDIYCAALDAKLDENGYIRPGIGDCGDRLYGSK